VGSFRYHNTLYGDAARGCHHRGDGPDASQRVISNNRQRLGVLVIEGFAAIPVGSMEPRVRITGEGGYASWQLRRRPRRSQQRRSQQRRRRSSYYFFIRLVVRSAPGFCGSPGALLFPQPSRSLRSKKLLRSIDVSGFIAVSHTPMALLLVVATTEATDPTRLNLSSRTTANVSKSSSLRLRGAACGVNGPRVRITWRRR